MDVWPSFPRDDDDRTPPTGHTHSDDKPVAEPDELVRVYHVTIPGTFVEVSLTLWTQSILNERSLQRGSSSCLQPKSLACPTCAFSGWNAWECSTLQGGLRAEEEHHGGSTQKRFTHTYIIHSLHTHMHAYKCTIYIHTYIHCMHTAIVYSMYQICIAAVSRGKRQWKPYYAYLKGFLLYLEPVSPDTLLVRNSH